MSSGPEDRYLAIVNPAAAKGRCARRAAPALERLRAGGLDVELRWTESPGDGTRLGREGFAEGFRQFIAGGGDGTNFEVLNGILPPALERGERVSLGFLPLGTGNSFVRDYSADFSEYSIESLLARRRRPCDALLLKHAVGQHYFINLCGIGMVADASIRSLKLKRWGAIAFVLAALETIVFASTPRLPLRADGGEWADGPVSMICVCNSRWAAQMMMAPDADIADGFVDLLHIEGMGRLRMIHTLSKLFSGRHVHLPRVTMTRAREIEFDIDREIDLMIDGEILRGIRLEAVELLPRALEVCV